MPIATFLRDVPEATQKRVRERYADDIQQLSTAGFSEYDFYSELLRPYSLIRDFPMLVLMRLKREVISRHPGLRAAGSYMLMRHDSPPTIALPMGMGLKLYTGFTDRFIVVSASFRSYAIPENNPLVQKHGDDVSIEEAWHLHRRRADGNLALGRTFREASYEHFVEMSALEESAVLPPKGRIAG
jgi:hypothetical protein